MASTMSARRLGRLQARLLAALRAHGTWVALQHLVYFAAGRAELGDTSWFSRGPRPPRSTYSSVARAVGGLRRRRLVETRLLGSVETSRAGKPHPTNRLWVRATVETLEGQP